MTTPRIINRMLRKDDRKLRKALEKEMKSLGGDIEYSTKIGGKLEATYSYKGKKIRYVFHGSPSPSSTRHTAAHLNRVRANLRMPPYD